MRKTLTDKGVLALKPRPQRYAFPDPQMTGHYVRVQPSGAKAFVTVARSPGAKQVWTTIAATDVMSIDEARTQAREIIKRVREGLPPIAAKAETFGDVAANWLKRHVEKNGLRTRKEIERLLNKHVLPVWEHREFTSIRRSDVAGLLDDVQDHRGARNADYCLMIIRAIANWYAARNDDYVPPTVRGMRRQNQGAQARARILDDDEIRAVWKAAEANGTLGAIIRLCLLTAQRRTKIRDMKWSDLSGNEWTIPKEAREKDTIGNVMLPEVAMAIIRAQPRMGNNPHVFAGRFAGPFQGFSQGKAAFDAKLPTGTPRWVLHDLRRTARSLMARAGVRPDIAERVLGHRIAGVHGVYDRHQYRDEKADALKRLAALVDSIINPRENVLPMRKQRTRK